MAMKQVVFSEDDSQIMCVTEHCMVFQCAIHIFSLNWEGVGRIHACSFPSVSFTIPLRGSTRIDEVQFTFHPIRSKATVMTFTHNLSLILTGHKSGKFALWDAKTGEEVLSNEHTHWDVMTDLQVHPDCVRATLR